ncbi:MAG: calcium-binding protein, partial [bacterium]|nr:calcium-binding protein [bacterium]
GGDDFLNGGAGDDKLFGDAKEIDPAVTTGADTFFFAEGSGNDTIGDFEVNKDTIDLGGYAAINAGNVNIDTITSPGDSIVVLDGSNSILVKGVTNLDPNVDFVYA